MKTYITTDKHPELKEGIEIGETGANIQKHEMFRSIEGHWKACDYTITNCLEKGYIKEVEKLEFTKSETLEFAIAWDHHFVREKSYKKELNNYFDIWIKSKEEIRDRIIST